MSRPQSSSAVASRPIRVDFRNRGADSAIIFIHGFGGHAEETWGDFPRFVMAHSELDRWDVFGIGYSSGLRLDLPGVWAADARLEDLGYYLRTALSLAPLDRYRRLALIAHSMGGLIAQQALLDEQCRARVSHLLLFGTPSAGVDKAGLARYVNKQARDMAVGSEFIASLRSAWPQIYADGQSLSMRAVAGERDAFVPTTSSLEPFPDALRFVVPGDHLSMVKPDDPSSPVVELVVQALRSVPKAASASAKNNLPRQLSSFIGRENELAEIEQLLSTAPLVTITGPGGIGKTRIALEAAADLLETMPDGAWFVDFAPLSDEKLVPSAIASVFNIEDKGTSQKLLDEVSLALKDKTALLILDNCEHILNAAAESADFILRRCPNVRMIATTREALAIAGEHVYRMPTLSSSEGLALFAERATAADPKFSVTETNTPIVEEIVRRLDGIALAIELAAPRVKVLDVKELAKRLDQRLTLLAGGSRTALPRQQTLRALISWSYELLNDAERSMLRQLSVFRGSFTLDAIDEVCTQPQDLQGDWDSLLLVSSLIDKSLVVSESGDPPRYRLLESTREYALEKLVEAKEDRVAMERHCACFVAASSRAYDALWRMNLEQWLAETRADLENYRAAIDWSLIDRNDPVAGAWIVANLLYLWDEALSTEGQHLLDQVDLSKLQDAPALLLGRMLLAVATFKSRAFSDLESCARAVNALEDADDPVSYADALRVYGRQLALAGKSQEAVQRCEEALLAIRSSEFPNLTARIQTSLGTWYSYAGDRERGLTMLEEALSTLRRLNDGRRLIVTLTNIAEVKFANGDIEAAIGNASEAITVSSICAPTSSDISPMLRANLAAYFLAIGGLESAWSYAREALQIALHVEGQRIANIALQHFAHIAALGGDTDRAALIIGHVDETFTAIGVPREYTEQVGYYRLMALLRERLTDERLSSLRAKGASAEEATIVAEAMAVPQPHQSLETPARA